MSETESRHPGFKNLEGGVFGKLSVESRVGFINGKTVWLCRCECGNTCKRDSSKLSSGRSKSCGCDAIRKISNSTRTHGHTSGDTCTPTYSSWCNMRKRVRVHPRYAGRGITICKEWDDYAVFLADMGPRPYGMSIDRIDPNGNYCKENCRWATQRDQCRNRCNAVFYTICGETRQLVEWAEFSHTWMGVFKSRVTSGKYEDGEVLFCPLGGKLNAQRQ